MKSPTDFNSLVKLMAYFKDEQTCLKHLEENRWNGNVKCPRCSHEKIWRFKDGKYFRCAGCKKRFQATTGTIFENSHVPLTKWYVAIYLIINHNKGISSYDLAKDLDVTQKTAWHMGMRIREAFLQDERVDVLGDVVEIDETFVGGKNKNRHSKKKAERAENREFQDKIPVLGILQRNGKVITKVVPNTRKKTLIPIVQHIVQEGSVIISDEWAAYDVLGEKYQHEVVRHGIGQYVNNDGWHSNTIESFWNFVKRSIMGVYHNLSKKHLQRYVNEMTFRYNMRKENGGIRLNFVIGNINTTLPYKKLIAWQMK